MVCRHLELVQALELEMQLAVTPALDAVSFEQCHKASVFLLELLKRLSAPSAPINTFIHRHQALASQAACG